MRKLAPLNYSASAPAILHAPEADPLVDAELGARPGSGRLLLTDGISQAGAARRARCVRLAQLLFRRASSGITTDNQSLGIYCHPSKYGRFIRPFDAGIFNHVSSRSGAQRVSGTADVPREIGSSFNERYQSAHIHTYIDSPVGIVALLFLGLAFVNVSLLVFLS